MIIISAAELVKMDTIDENNVKDIEHILEASFRATSRVRAFMNFGRKHVS